MKKIRFILNVFVIRLFKKIQKHKIKIQIILLSLIVLIFSSYIGCLIYSNINDIERYDNIALYKTNDYLLLNNQDTYIDVSNRSNVFFPKYDDFVNKDIINGFYIFDGRMTITRTSLSFVLELKFENLQEYEEYLTYEMDRCSYTNKYNISHKNYECLITIDKNITYYRYNKDIPYAFGMLCYNKDRLIIRYVYFEECEGPVEKNFKIVFKNTNCDW